MGRGDQGQGSRSGQPGQGQGGNRDTNR
jgi:hypothetical protein